MGASQSVSVPHTSPNPEWVFVRQIGTFHVYTVPGLREFSATLKSEDVGVEMYTVDRTPEMLAEQAALRNTLPETEHVICSCRVSCFGPIDLTGPVRIRPQVVQNGAVTILNWAVVRI